MQIYSPVQALNFEHLHPIWVKRDDLIDPYISGNKWRKLQHILADAQQRGQKHLVTFGGAYSNHLVATAAAASRHGFQSTAFVRGETVQNEMLLLCKLFGMQLIFVDRESYKDKRNLFDKHFATNQTAYFIDEGGASAEAVRGCAAIITELPLTYNHIFCAAGTGTTAAGLLQGINAQQLHTQLHVVPVLKNGGFIADEIAKYEPNLSRLTLHTDYSFGGYAKTTPQLLKFMTAFVSQTGLLVDPVYTAKLFFAINDLAGKDFFKKDDKILAIHTGGLLGIWGMQEKLTQMLG
ncbi:1-aminocyclopropane-1-carboxylate deaminase/D-cysteine desulfhydrase [Pedobacter sp. ASV12]|uniref:1-aminocyclopropane-1-carboxylate deaminase/D-cysteine desulfhydrase n=1 Tax=Pedobacter sp. ASV12 TaxID=2795120 RepID=UPI0018EBDE79|nr:pyridoxal-phosphate dependent enzyme [Pedobacter sp. ASV12]